MSGNQQPQGQQNPLSAFGFKPTDTSNATNSNPGGPFGAFGSTPSAFGMAQNNATNTPAAPKASAFGGGGFGQQPALAGPGGSTFGSSQTGGNAFGGAPAFGTTSGPTSTPAPNPLFGGASNTPGALGGSFGSTPTNQPTQTGTTDANATPSGSNLFGNAPPNAFSGGAFGNTQSTYSQPGSNVFGALNNQSSGMQPGGTTNASASAAPNPLFGNTASSTPATTPAKPSPFGNFGAKPAETSTQSGAAPSSGQPALPSLFGTPKPASPAPGAASSTTPSLFANLPKKPETGPAQGTSTPSAFSNLAAPKDASKDGEKDAKTGAPAAASDSSSKDASSKDSAPAPSPLGAFNLGGNKDASASKPQTPQNAGATAPATAPPVTSVPAPSMLRGKTVEDIVNRWTTELETQTRDFSQIAGEVAAWDRTLIENGNYISALYATVLAAESTQASLDQSLDHVEHQQRNLTATLDQYEKTANEIFHGSGGIMTSTEGLGLADSERDKSYAMAANLHTQLDDLSRSLTQMVETVNGLNVSSGPDDASQDDAISTIAGILNAHLSSLQWIDGALNEMDDKVKDAERRIKDSSARGGARTDGMNRSRGYGLGSSRR